MVNPANVSSKTGILLVNLGTPDAPTPFGVMKFLRKFLWDPRVVSLPRVIWWFLLHGFVLPLRSWKVAKYYQRIWTVEGSPLRVYTTQLSKQLSQYLSNLTCQTGIDIPVLTAMTYGNPSLTKQIASLHERQISRLIVLPLFPYYSGTTTAAVLDRVTTTLRKQRVVPSLVFISEYGLEESYLDAVALTITEHWSEKGRAERLLFSFHGIPKRCENLGDPYAHQCRKASEKIAKRLNISRDFWEIGFQSRFGFSPWVLPNTDELLMQWGQEGVKTVDIISPSFAVDCLETLEELCYRSREKFLKVGGETLRYIPAMNNRTCHVSVLGNLIAKYL